MSRTVKRRVRVSVRVPTHLHTAVKARATTEGVTPTSVVESALRAWLHSGTRPLVARHVAAAAAAATGAPAGTGMQGWRIDPDVVKAVDAKCQRDGVDRTSVIVDGLAAYTLGTDCLETVTGQLAALTEGGAQ